MESFNDALVVCVKACGGTKQVGALLWPEKAPDAAQRALLDCLNEDRPAKLSPEQVLLILRLARGKGCHDGMGFITAELGYAPPVPVEPRDEIAELQRQFIEAVRAQTELAQRIERAAGRVSMRAVA
ncbi:hypothetical protein [Delftia acidovorans]|uniref:hypothetical protein n=1 Tax=Delftia acidovorans TaxID=80866 RepID=UPI00241C0690|nr:hypothetical protein [Delftia acidovorans]